MGSVDGVNLILSALSIRGGRPRSMWEKRKLPPRSRGGHLVTNNKLKAYPLSPVGPVVPEDVRAAIAAFAACFEKEYDEGGLFTGGLRWNGKDAAIPEGMVAKFLVYEEGFLYTKDCDCSEACECSLHARSQNSMGFLKNVVGGMISDYLTPAEPFDKESGDYETVSLEYYLSVDDFNNGWDLRRAVLDFKEWEEATGCVYGGECEQGLVCCTYCLNPCGKRGQCSNCSKGA